ncbi:hypothetical protein SAMN05192533_110112 [Mesobacillus persicus]|uniref:ABC-2 family transporter protein n=2 Tax=Mesobacillus persicus TaxID=930146 RepID=A0A1H8EUP7_9BACI|nr:hypothetical protein SAMN05192533_110112 [Mesobacillus persicus]
MSLTTTSLAETVKKQYFYKLKANIDSFSSLVGIQILAILFSLGGISSSGMGGSFVNVNVKYYSPDLVLVFTLIWSFITAVTITTRPYRNHDFSFVTSRLSSSLSNILFLVTASVLGSVTALLSGNLLQMISYLILNEQLYNIGSGAEHMVLGFVVAFLYLMLIGACGYLIGSLIQVSKLFVLLFPILFIGLLFLEGVVTNGFIVSNVYKFYAMESVLFLFVGKTVLTAVALFIAAISILNRLEVRR